MSNAAATDVVMLRLVDVHPSPENDKLYRPVDPKDPEIRALAQSIRERGLLEPLIVTFDDYILSGHRRHAACHIAGLKHIPCRVLDIARSDDPDEFVRLLREYNRQRVKSFDERLREEVISVDEGDAYAHLQEYRKGKSGLGRISREAMVATLPERRRAEISVAKRPMLAAAQKIIDELENHWPLSVRQVHYRVVAGGTTVLRHANKPNSAYRNDKASYKDLCNLLARARIAGAVQWDAICDETRPFESWTTWKEPGAFMRNELDGFAKRYWRDLLQSQANHIEIVAEKLTVKTIVERVGMHYTVPMQIGRGFSDAGLRHNLAERFTKSGREKLVVILVGDLDPDGEGICESFQRSMRDDFGIVERRIVAIKAALRRDQVKAFRLPPSMLAKTTSSRFARFEQRHGSNAWELEALSPELLESELRKAIDSVIDHDAFEHEREEESKDAKQIEATRKTMFAGMREGGTQ